MKEKNSITISSKKSKPKDQIKKIPSEGITNFAWEKCINYSKKNIINYKNLLDEDKKKYSYLENFIIKPINIGDVVVGTIYKMDENDIWLDVMSKYSIVCDNEIMAFPELEGIGIGSNIEVLISSKDKDNSFKGSISSFMKRNIKDILFRSLKQKTPIVVKVEEVTKGGYMTSFQGIKLFMPFTLANINKIIDNDELLEKELPVIIDNYDQAGDSFVVSHREYLENRVPIEIKKLKTNEIYVGIVTGVTKFGVFVQFNECLVGMIHKDNIVDEYKDKLLEIPLGIEIEFYYKEIVKDRIILTQFLRSSIWDTISVGDIYDGTISKIEAYGAFVQLDSETRGLIGINELKKWNKTYTGGEEVKVRVSAIIKDSKKIVLTLIQ